MNNHSSNVMNNDDLRKEIISYFKNKPIIKCLNCKKACYNNYYKFPLTQNLFDQDISEICYLCSQCYWFS